MLFILLHFLPLQLNALWAWCSLSSLNCSRYNLLLNVVMFSKLLLLVSLFAAVVVAAPAPSNSELATPSIIGAKSNVSCTIASWC